MSDQPPVIRLDGRDLVADGAFHAVFAKALGFPAFYGNNMSAWVDCMTNLDDPSAELLEIHVERGHCLTVHIEDAKILKEEAPLVWDDLTECAAFVNWRRIEMGEPPVLALAYYV